MTLNDFKSIKGDTELGLLSLPVQLGAWLAAILACLVMVGARVVVVCLFFSGNSLYSLLSSWSRLVPSLTVCSACLPILSALPLVKRHRREPLRHRHVDNGFCVEKCHLMGGRP